MIDAAKTALKTIAFAFQGCSFLSKETLYSLYEYAYEAYTNGIGNPLNKV